MPKAKPRRGGTFYVSVDVDIDAADLEDAGFHHEDDCPAKKQAAPTPSSLDIADALASLHRQAHPSASPEIFACPEEPCRSLGLDQIGYTGRPAVARHS